MAAGQRDALRLLYDETVDLAYAAAFGLLVDAVLAEDAVAEVYVQIWYEAPRYDADRSTVRGWITMMTRTRALDLRRKKHRRGEQYMQVLTDDQGSSSRTSMGEAWETAPESVFKAACDTEYAAAIQRAVASLPRDQRAAVECSFFLGLTHGEIAARLDAPLGTIKTRIRTALESLRHKLGVLQAEWHEPMAAPEQRLLNGDTQGEKG